MQACVRSQLCISAHTYLLIYLADYHQVNIRSRSWMRHSVINHQHDANHLQSDCVTNNRLEQVSNAIQMCSPQNPKFRGNVKNNAATASFNHSNEHWIIWITSRAQSSVSLVNHNVPKTKIAIQRSNIWHRDPIYGPLKLGNLSANFGRPISTISIMNGNVIATQACTINDSRSKVKYGLVKMEYLSHYPLSHINLPFFLHFIALFFSVLRLSLSR